MNGQKIQTFGKASFKFNFGQGKTYHHEAIIGEIHEIIVGWDFVLRHRLDIQWSQNGQCKLVDYKAKKQFKLRIAEVPLANLSLQLGGTSFKAWSQEKSQEASKSEKSVPIPTAYQKLLDKYSDILTIDFTKTPIIK